MLDYGNKGPFVVLTKSQVTDVSVLLRLITLETEKYTIPIVTLLVIHTVHRSCHCSDIKPCTETNIHSGCALTPSWQGDTLEMDEVSTGENVTGVKHIKSRRDRVSLTF